MRALTAACKPPSSARARRNLAIILGTWPSTERSLKMLLVSLGGAGKQDGEISANVMDGDKDGEIGASNPRRPLVLVCSRDADVRSSILAHVPKVRGLCILNMSYRGEAI